jgi:hypothetical protein
MTDMGYEDPSEGAKHPGWVICNASENDEPADDLSEIYLCNNNRPNSWFIYPNEKMIYEEDRYLRNEYTPDPPFFLGGDNLALYNSKCVSCSNSPYPTYSQPICQCPQILDHAAFAKASPAEKNAMKAKYELPLPFNEGPSDGYEFKVTTTTSPCYLKLFSEPGSFKLM